MRGNNGLIEFTELVYKEGQTYLEKHQIEAPTPHHKLEITIAVLEHLENHNELTKIPINMHQMNHWMKRYPILAEKIELGIDLDKPGKV